MGVVGDIIKNSPAGPSTGIQQLANDTLQEILVSMGSGTLEELLEAVIVDNCQRVAGQQVEPQQVEEVLAASFWTAYWQEAILQIAVKKSTGG
ncbi:MAG: hypothetical protein ACI9OJ_003135 [Myxococcota bacterium]